MKFNGAEALSTEFLTRTRRGQIHRVEDESYEETEQ